MECNISRALIALGRRELTVADAAALEAHLAACPACAAAARQSFGFDEAVGRVMTAVPVPTGLRADLLKLAYARRGHDLRRKIYQWAALAAAVLITVGIGFGGYWQSRPDFNPHILAEATERNREQPEHAVRAWLAAADLPTRLPYDFDYRLHMFHGKETIDGRDVPVILFAQGRDVARVYMVRKSQFNMDQAGTYAKSSLCTVEIFSEPHVDVVFVVTYTTESINPFLLQRSTGPVA